MIVVLLNTYRRILFLLVCLKFVPFNLFWKISPVIVLLLLILGLFIPMGWARRRARRWCCAIRSRSCRPLRAR